MDLGSSLVSVDQNRLPQRIRNAFCELFLAGASSAHLTTLRRGFDESFSKNEELGPRFAYPEHGSAEYPPSAASVTNRFLPIT